MIPCSSFSLIVHALILLIRFLGRTLGLSANKLKAIVLRWGLRISPRLCLRALSRDFFLRQVFAYLIITSVFILVTAGAVFSFRTSLQNGNNYSIVAALFKGAPVMAGQKNSEEISQPVDSSINAVNSSAQSQAPEQTAWLVAEYRPIDNSVSINYHTKSSLKPRIKPTINKRLLLDKN